METQLIIYLLIACIVLLLINIILSFSTKSNNANNYKEIDNRLDKFNTDNNTLFSNTLQSLNNSISSSIELSSKAQIERLDIYDKNIRIGMDNMAEFMYKANLQSNESQQNALNNIKESLTNSLLLQQNQLESIRTSVDTNLTNIRKDNNEKLDQMRKTVDEKLEETLQSRLTQSFKMVSEQLEAVHKSLGEMQNITTSVTDLKAVLSNVKTRGILGETQLKMILSEMLSDNQYDENINTNPNSSERVEFAIKLPNTDSGFIYLPIDSKFPLDSYNNYQKALEENDKALIDSTRKILVATFKKEAKDISSKYICLPYTTDFAIMFLPTESLYCQAINEGMLDILQREYHVCIAGPSTMAALLNSLQMGFKTLAIQKRSSEVWNILGSVKTEFSKFEDVLNSAQAKIQQTSNELDKLIGVRTRAINRQLKNVEENNLYTTTYDKIDVGNED